MQAEEVKTPLRKSPFPLTIELVPKSCWFSNLRSELPRKDWDRLRKKTYEKAQYRCEICGGKGDKWTVECHEIWAYDDLNKIQKLDGLIALCPPCHQVKHFGFANINNKGKEALIHLAQVNAWPLGKASLYVEKCFVIWENRSKYPWTLDISILQEFQISLPENSYLNEKQDVNKPSTSDLQKQEEKKESKQEKIATPRSPNSSFFIKELFGKMKNTLKILKDYWG